MQSNRDLRERTKQLALRVIRLYRMLPPGEEARILGKLLRSGTSVGANYRAACRARSKAEFIAKLGIVLEEADETVFWLELLIEAGIGNAERVQPLLKEADELTSIFVSSLCTAKQIAP
ncbi:MAG TPA: four helix bundle protein [Candidatus Solibacter sp.]|nr:four helix bundle protein [Candidatus Solibacter sp.]